MHFNLQGLAETSLGSSSSIACVLVLDRAIGKVCCVVQDPFELSHDLGRTVDRQTSGVLHKEFERAACILADLAQPLDRLMEPYRAGKTD